MSDQKYISVDREFILKVKYWPEINLFRSNTASESDQVDYQLFVNGKPNQRVIPKLLEAAAPKSLFITEEEGPQYVEFLADNLKSYLKNPLCSFREKAEKINHCATEVIKAVFDNPNTPNGIACVRNVVTEIVNFALTEAGAIKELLSLNTNEYLTYTHCIHVAFLCVGFGKIFGIRDRNELSKLGLGGLLHDIGKTQVDQKILNKPGRLTTAEFEEIKKHPRKGYDILKEIIPKQSLDVVLHHHEKNDGSGYPDHLAGEDISLFAKVSCLADVFDAITSNRVYAKARAPFDAMIMMKQEMVGQFEDDKFKAFITMLGPKVKV